jgi:hypothetical protein
MLSAKLQQAGILVFLMPSLLPSPSHHLISTSLSGKYAATWALQPPHPGTTITTTSSGIFLH